MHFNWCTIQVNNMEDSIRFYQDIVGLPLNRRFQSGADSEIAFLGDGDTKIELIYNKRSEPITIGNDISIGFETTSLEETIKFLKENNIEISGGPFSPNPTITFIYVKDPNGLTIQFAQHLQQ